jgi:hypothetical protein
MNLKKMSGTRLNRTHAVLPAQQFSGSCGHRTKYV